MTKVGPSRWRILTDDLQRAAIEIIKLMFQRWLQENDFKYLDKHFGLNQITSYRSIEYEKLKAQVEDRAVKSAARTALDLKLKQVTEPLKRHLLAEEQARQAHQLRAGKGPELAAKLALEKFGRHARIQRTAPASGGAQGRRATLRDDATGTTKEHRARPQRNGGPASANRRDPSPGIAFGSDDPGGDGENGGPVQAAPGCSRITVRNLFYHALQPFKKAYDNYRDDHDYFRKLTQSPGVMEVRAQEIVIHLMPRTNYGGELRKAVSQTLEGMNALGLGHPCLPARKLKFRLGNDPKWN